MSDIKLLHGRVLVEPKEPEEIVTDFGIVLPPKNSESAVNALEGTVIKGGELVSEGQRVLFSRYGYDPMRLDGKIYYAVNERLLLAYFT